MKVVVENKIILIIYKQTIKILFDYKILIIKVLLQNKIYNIVKVILVNYRMIILIIKIKNINNIL